MTPENMMAIGAGMLIISLWLKVRDLRQRIERLEQK